MTAVRRLSIATRGYRGVSSRLSIATFGYRPFIIIIIPDVVVRDLVLEDQLAGVITTRSNNPVDKILIEAIGFKILRETPRAGQHEFLVTGYLPDILELSRDKFAYPHVFWRLPEGAELTMHLVLMSRPLNDEDTIAGDFSDP